MHKRLRLVSVAAFVSALFCVAVGAGHGEGPPGAVPPRPIPGITAPDQFPRGCVDCHVDLPDMRMDKRISTAMRVWQEGVAPEFLARIRPFVPSGMRLEGKHPRIRTEVADIPGACLKCHSKGSKTAPPFARLLHGLHLVVREENHFLTLFQGECTHCHKYDAGAGLWSLGSGTEEK